MRNNKSYTYFLITAVLLYTVVLVIAFAKKSNPYLWYDEAGQFWIAKGLNHDSPPLQAEKGLISVVENNAHYNMDPGGFSVLLHYWSKISDSYNWLRLLPFLFFIAFIVAFIYWVGYKTRNWLAAALTGFIPLVIPMLFNSGLEIRAYSMEMLGTVTGIILLERLASRLTIKRLLITGIVFAFFMTSRYAEIVVIFVYSLYVLYLVYRSAFSFQQKLVALAAYAIPVLISLAGIYFFSFAIQNPGAAPLFYLPYLRTDPGILLLPQHLAYLFVILTLLILWLTRKRIPAIKKYETLLLLCISINVLFIILSFAGMHPWSALSTRCVSLFLLTLLCVVSVVGEILVVGFKKPVIWKYGVGLAVVLLLLYSRKSTFLLLQRPDNVYTVFKRLYVNKYRHIYVGGWEAPSTRYLFEYGKLRSISDGLYPARFTLAKSRESVFHKRPASLEDIVASQPVMDDLVDYDLLITPDLYGKGHHDLWRFLEGTNFFFVRKDSAR